MHLNRPITTVPMVSVCPLWADPRHSRRGRGYLPVEDLSVFNPQVGTRIGRLVVISSTPVLVDSGARKRKAFVCRCDCGTVKPVLSGDLSHGSTVSCGCYRKDNQQITNRKNAKTTCYNGKHPLHQIWAGMHQRCTNPSVRCYDRYGGRGIKVCERWNSFEAFVADMGERPSKRHSLDRYPDKDGNYEPGNCRWATASQQGNNTSVNHLVTFCDKTQTVTEWANQIGMKPQTLWARIVIQHWTPEKAITTPLNPPRPRREKKPKKPREKKPSIWPVLDVQAIVEMHNSGLSMRAIGKSVGTTHTRIGDVLARHFGMPTHDDKRKAKKK